MATPTFLSKDLARVESRVLPAAIPLELDTLNTVTQVRKVIEKEKITELAESIRRQGQQTPGRVVALEEDEARQYIREINLLWNGSAGFKAVSFRQLKPVSIDGVLYYLIVIYGHRRLEACRYAYRQRWLNGKFDGKYLCEIYFGLTVEEAIPMQLAENFYVPVPKHEEIAAVWRFWLYEKKKDPNISRTKFARMIGRTPGWVREMLHFTDLPMSVQRRIQPDAPGGTVAYSLILQVARLVREYKSIGNPMEESDINELIDELLLRQVNAAAYAKEVSRTLELLQMGQGEMFAHEKIKSRRVRKIAQQGLIRSLMTAVNYLHLVNQMMRSDAFGGRSPYSDNPEKGPGEYSPHSPGKMSLRLMYALGEIVPLIAIMVERDGVSARQLREQLSKLGISKAVFRAHVLSQDKNS